MAERKNLCVMVTEVVGSPALDASLGIVEARHAVDRAMRRIDLALEANNGIVLKTDANSVTASFERTEQAILAACEMLERIKNLPPLAGKRLAVRLGLHYGPIDPDTDPAADESVAVATRLLKAARGGEALATGSVVVLLPAPTRHFARPDNETRDELADLEWPLYSIARQPDAIVSLPPASRFTQRLRIRHQNEEVYLDDQRPILLFGRELGNDVVIMDPRASRQHCRIERRRDGFALVDYSSNGCYVVEESGSERRIRQEEVSIVGPGRIGCGFSASDVERDLVFFEIV